MNKNLLMFQICGRIWSATEVRKLRFNSVWGTTKAMTCVNDLFATKIQVHVYFRVEDAIFLISIALFQEDQFASE